MKPADARAFAHRDWVALAELKRSHWAARFRTLGPNATLRAAAALWEHARLVRPDWPTPRDRAEDLAHHIELKRQIDRVAHAFARR